MEIKGFKCFDKGLTNYYGQTFKVGKIYIASGAIQFGTQGNGFHLCKRMEDTLRYFDAMHKEVDICEVVGSGTISESFDDYYGYYDMYAVSHLEILKKLSREEIISLAFTLDKIRLSRFIRGFKLTEDEIKMLIDRFEIDNDSTLFKEIEYYQRNNLDAFSRKR